MTGGYQYIDSDDDVWKRAGDVSYALRYAGIGKRWSRPVSVATRSRGGKRRTNYAIKYGGIGKRDTDDAVQRLLDNDDITSRVAFIGSAGDSSDVTKRNMALKYAGIGKRTGTYGSENEKITNDKRARNMALKYVGIGKRDEYKIINSKRAGNIALKYVGIGKRQDPAAAYEHQDWKRAKSMALKYAGIGKKSYGEEEDIMIDDKRAQNMALKYAGIGKRTMDGVDTISDNKRAKNMALKYVGIGKRIASDVATIDSDVNGNKRAANFAMKYAGIGKRFGTAGQHDEVTQIQRPQALMEDVDLEQSQQQMKTVSHNSSTTSPTSRRTKRQVFEPLELSSNSHEPISISLLEDEPSVDDEDVDVTLDATRQWLGDNRHSYDYYSSPLAYHLYAKRAPPNNNNYGIRYVGIGR